MNDINTLNYNGNEIKYMRKEDSSAYICLKDICDTLGLLNSNNVGKRIPDEYKEYVDVKYELTHDSLGNPVYRDIPTVFIASKGIELFLNTSRKRELAGNLLNWLKSVELIHSEDYIMNLQDVKGIRGYVDDNNVVYLNLEDVCRGLGFTRISHSGYEVVRWYIVKEYLEYIESMGEVCNLPKDGYDNHSGLPEYIPENVYYLLAMKASNPIAFKFQQKIANEILPMIRRTGMYMAEQVYNRLVSDPIQLGEMMLDYGRVKKELEDNRYKMNSYDRFMESKQSFSMATVAKSLIYTNPNKNNSIIGRNELFAILRDLNILQTGSDTWNMPYQEYVDQGYFQINIKEINSKGNTVFIKQAKVLPKGIEFIINILNENGYSINNSDIPDEIN